MATINVHTSFLLTNENGNEVRYNRGIHEVDKKTVMHWLVNHNADILDMTGSAAENNNVVELIDPAKRALNAKKRKTS
jgi:hypothetical protein